MTDDLDIYRAAKLVIDRHGEDAALFAEARAVVLKGEGCRGRCHLAADQGSCRGATAAKTTR